MARPLTSLTFWTTSAVLAAAACGSSSGDTRGDGFGGFAAVGGMTNTGGASADAGATGGSAGTGAVAGVGGMGTGGLLGVGGAGGTGGSGNAPATGGTAGIGVGGGAGAGACGGTVPPDVPAPSDSCGNGLDDNLNGFIDENCGCSLAQSQPCFGGPPSQATAPNCTMGTQTCEGSPEFPGWGACLNWGCDNLPPPQEVCNNGADDDCDGQVDEGCALDVAVNIPTDCSFADCPPQAPHPVGCTLTMTGGDSRGCVATIGSRVFFKEGDACPFLGLPGAGDVKGTLICSSQPGPPLDQMSCAINKANPMFFTNPGMCPGGFPGF